MTRRHLPDALTSRRLPLTFVAALVALAVTTTVGAARPVKVGVAILAPGNGQTLSGSVTWEAGVTSGAASRIVFSIDGSDAWTETLSPYVFNGDGGKLDTTTPHRAFTVTVTPEPSARMAAPTHKAVFMSDVNRID